MKFGLSQAVARTEDAAFLRGAGRYVADLVPGDALRAVVLRTPHAHARIRSVDTTAAAALRGVRLVLTAADLAALGPLPCLGIPRGVTVEPADCPVLAGDVVRHVGDAVAFVVADTVERARDAAEAIVVEVEPLPHVVDPVAALSPDAPPVWPGRAGNVAYTQTLGDAAATERAFAAAAHVVELRLVNQRLVANYMDTRAVTAAVDQRDGRITLTLGSQGSHTVRDILAEHVLRIPPERLRVITPDVGGGFGTKLFPYREYALAAVAAERLGRTVSWVADRADHFLGDSQGRANVTTARLALDADHRFLALDVDMVCDMGAYLSCYAPYIPFAGAGMLPGVYDIPACHVRIRGVFTNTVPVDAYRGAGRPEASYVIERLVDTAARDLGVAPDDLRRRNFVAPAAMPYTTATGKVYDTGDFAAHMARAQEIADWAGFPHRAAEARHRGRLRGIALATYVEACGAVGPETATLRLDRDGVVTVLIGSQSTGQGHATAYAQIVAEHLGVPPSRVRVVQGDTDAIATGAGTGGSSSIPVGGVAVDGAANRLAEVVKAIAADALEAAAADLELADGVVRIAGTDRTVSLSTVATAPQATPARLTVAETVRPKAATYPNGTHLAEVEIDPETGAVTIVRYVIVDDVGMTLNPLLLAGQIHGGVAQGLGQALMEQAVYDRDSGQLVTATLQDYALPRAGDLPDFVFETRNVPCATNPLGVKGAGEAGTIGAAPAVINAVVDALWRARRIRDIDMPATAQAVWAALREHDRMHAL
ncbi:xanthine dehydrogenase family protein molybdopterin-binding subunit [Rhodoplanes sp. TEM]|uniref:Xanthine dehydrogenase family protein molybdopterin-binding subunit n=1 Tax=Rhodoplanes tepidamans TaxID=200616 RepID=A0ABT5JAB3_RHOTP|nr:MULTISPECIES: xanthine dehydrogenase family protein molybdopterin-binding subunit [Rhodoplanes]MDC7786628.1 xanthine dehydrogenase family protein molybdopterin-binding subunit [Rhodoplanes tepidamans]MDC7983025.1 xanthine dehydrogenase family protein molybdopterin-binding subunit [Rhodoplanes sp. TEM]MDQ0356407.1 carbon-monoxide dehydrogenase large subunit [Rhodoplanes tepidamans]